jgi:prophage antirepressor-like protein
VAAQHDRALAKILKTRKPGDEPGFFIVTGVVKAKIKNQKDINMPTLAWVSVNGPNDADLTSAEVIAEHGRGAFVMLSYFLRSVQRRHAGRREISTLLLRLSKDRPDLPANFSDVHMPMVEHVSYGQPIKAWALSLSAVIELMKTFPEEFDQPEKQIQEWEKIFRPAQSELDAIASKPAGPPALFFNFDERKVRIRVIGGKVWFAAIDVATTLDYSDTKQAVRQHCKNQQSLESLHGNGKGGQNDHPSRGDEDYLHPHTNMIDRADVMRLIVGSKLPAAQRFERKVFEEILPKLMERGYYILPGARPQLGLNPESPAERILHDQISAEQLDFAGDQLKAAASTVRREREARLLAEAENVELKAENADLRGLVSVEAARADAATAEKNAIEMELREEREVSLERKKTIDAITRTSYAIARRSEEKLQARKANPQLDLRSSPPKTPEIGDETDMPTDDDTKH